MWGLCSVTVAKGLCRALDTFPAGISLFLVYRAYAPYTNKSPGRSCVLKIFFAFHKYSFGNSNAQKMQVDTGTQK